MIEFNYVIHNDATMNCPVLNISSVNSNCQTGLNKSNQIKIQTFVNSAGRKPVVKLKGE